MAHYSHNTFVGQRILIDGHRFENNRFENCVLVVSGRLLHMVGNELIGVRWEFVDAAARTAGLLASFYQVGGESRLFVKDSCATFGKPASPPVPTTPPSAPRRAAMESHMSVSVRFCHKRGPSFHSPCLRCLTSLAYSVPSPPCSSGVAIWLATNHKRDADKVNSDTSHLLTDIRSETKAISQGVMEELRAYGNLCGVRSPRNHMSTPSSVPVVTPPGLEYRGQSTGHPAIRRASFAFSVDPPFRNERAGSPAIACSRRPIYCMLAPLALFPSAAADAQRWAAMTMQLGRVWHLQ